MKLFSEVDLHPSRRDLLKFGLVVLTCSCAAGAWTFERGHTRTGVSLAVFGAAMFVAALLPVVGRFAYIGWMTLGVALGRVTSPIVLLVVYALLVVPLGLAFRLRGRALCSVVVVTRRPNPTGKTTRARKASRRICGNPERSGR